MADSSSDPEARRWRGRCSTTGLDYHDAKDYAKALPLFERALAARKEDGDDRSIREARWAVARCLRSLGRYDEALKEQLALDAEATKANEPDGFVWEELGELYYAKGQKEGAKPWFAKAYTELNADPYIRYNEVARIARLKELSGRRLDRAHDPARRRRCAIRVDRPQVATGIRAIAGVRGIVPGQIPGDRERNFVGGRIEIARVRDKAHRNLEAAARIGAE
jgi:tetratricopeptide (TPR) repeat protein